MKIHVYIFKLYHMIDKKLYKAGKFVYYYFVLMRWSQTVIFVFNI